MKRAKLLFAATLFEVCFLITNSSSQTAPGVGSSVLGVFEATTPCDDAPKALLKIPSGTKCEMMKWKLTLYQNAKTLAPSDYKLACEYGLPKQGTRGFMEGSVTMKLNGNWTVSKGTNENAEAVVCQLRSDNSPVSLSFLRPDQNLLHFLDGDKRLMIGNGAWSYTLNRIDPIVPSPGKVTAKTSSAPPIATDSSIVGVFDGRTPCYKDLLELTGISAAGCQIIKLRLTLSQDVSTHTPTTFEFQTIYVGKGDTKYTPKGKWRMTQGTKTDPQAIVYQLDSEKPNVSLLLQKADDNILFFLDKERNLLVGNNYSSYTLNRVRK